MCVRCLLAIVAALLLAGSSLAFSSATGRCVHRLRDIDLAKDIVATDKNLPVGTTIPDAELGAYLTGKEKCPEGGVYTIGPVGTKAVCSILTHTPSEFSRQVAAHKRATRITFLLQSTGVVVAFAIGLIVFLGMRGSKSAFDSSRGD